MKFLRLLCLAPLLLCGCVQVVHELHNGPFPYNMLHHSRVTGFDVSIPNQAGGDTVRIRFGWVSETTTLIVCSTNPIYAAPVSDTFRLGNNFSLTGDAVTITEDVQTFAPGAQPPTPRFQQLFTPKAKQ